MTDLLGPDDGATPLEPEELRDLIPSHITLRSELNEAEQAGILEADDWAFRRSRDVLDERFLTGLHKRMFGKVWRWAGSFRRTERNIGIEAYRITVELRHLLEDVRYWIKHATYDNDEIALRFHHRLVAIHPSPNGNGRHARLAADLLAVKQGRPRFTWGQGNIGSVGDVRRAYIDSLRAADRHDVSLLLTFGRS